MNACYEHSKIDDDKLLKAIDKNPDIQTYFKASFEGIKSTHHCGILHVDGEDFYILPKITQDKKQNLTIFIYMLMKAYDLKLYHKKMGKSENQKHNFLESLVQYFAKNLLQEFSKGLYKTYISRQDNIKLLRGKYLVSENLKHNFTHEKIYCEFDEFSEDNKLNHFFLYALKTLLPFTEDKKLIKKCLLCLDEVEFEHINISTFKMDFNRQNKRYKSSFELAMLLLHKLIPLFDKGKKSFAFLFNMNDLFERFVGNLTKEIEPNAELQNSRNFNKLILEPDIKLSHIIIDTKYKKLTEPKAKQNDKLQAYAYGINFKKENVMLLFPKYQIDINESLILGKDETKIALHIRTLDLYIENCEFDEYILEMKERIKEIL